MMTGAKADDEYYHDGPDFNRSQKMTGYWTDGHHPDYNGETWTDDHDAQWQDDYHAQFSNGG